jgi:hypothetical protein
LNNVYSVLVASLLVAPWALTNAEPSAKPTTVVEQVVIKKLVRTPERDKNKSTVSRSRIHTPANSRTYAKTLVSPKQFKCLNTLWTRESNWNHKANNPTSTAYGIPQLLKLTERNPYKQIDLGIKYIKHRYGTPCNALRFSDRNNWY